MSKSAGAIKGPPTLFYMVLYIGFFAFRAICCEHRMNILCIFVEYEQLFLFVKQALKLLT